MGSERGGAGPCGGGAQEDGCSEARCKRCMRQPLIDPETPAWPWHAPTPDGTEPCHTGCTACIQVFHGIGLLCHSSSDVADLSVPSSRFACSWTAESLRLLLLAFVLRVDVSHCPLRVSPCCTWLWALLLLLLLLLMSPSSKPSPSFHPSSLLLLACL